MAEALGGVAPRLHAMATGAVVGCVEVAAAQLEDRAALLAALAEGWRP